MEHDARDPDRRPEDEPLSTEPQRGGWPSEDMSRGDEAPEEPWPERVEEAETTTAWPTADRGEARAAEAGLERAGPPPEEAEAFDGGEAGGAVPAGGAAHSVPATNVSESTRCPRCGTENRPGLAFCSNCGQRLVAAGVNPTVERPGAPEGTLACPRCGTHNRSGVAFCQNCGANLRATSAAPGYVPPAVSHEPSAATDVVEEEPAGRAVLGPIVLLIGAIGIAVAYLLPFPYGGGSLFERAVGAGGYGAAFWNGYPEVAGTLADQAYFGFAAPTPVLVAVLVVLVIAGFLRAAPGPLQRIGLIVSLLWAIGLIALFVVAELAASWSGDIVGLLRGLSPGGIIFLLASLIVLIGTLTRLARS